LKTYLSTPDIEHLPAIIPSGSDPKSFANEREILYQILFDMRRDISELKKLVPELLNNNSNNANIQTVPEPKETPSYSLDNYQPGVQEEEETAQYQYADEVSEEEKEEEKKTEPEKALSLEEVEREMIKKALERHSGKRRNAASDLKISERTLYRKIKEYGLE
jgi:transcriptional regulator with PAS, ATPase and Fis domain